MSCRRLSLIYSSKRTSSGWRVSITADGLAPVSEEAPTSDEAKTAAYASLQRLVDESEARGRPIRIEDYAVQTQFDPEEVFQ
ncbi:hypothetical protein QEG98_28475 [Myxococcus sp. MxC21-1]|uniref:hypothetical protein n=1 Tax=Myxococcus sp. MxC21-1 TaxID=3041439 RepID=UPI00292F00DC|nr:hypothetical protein [Myxococcus sp. MxC21-1]WNZ59943.1 hypothetical protein QEG98_28475 [Myxococcus sp. MxC21-1]